MSSEPVEPQKCPVCKRSFKDLDRHMAKRHPDAAPPTKGKRGAKALANGLTRAQQNELLRSVRAGADLDTAATAAGIFHIDIDELLEKDVELAQKISQAAARAEVEWLKAAADTRPGFLLERLLPQTYSRTTQRQLQPEAPDDKLGEIGL